MKNVMLTAGVGAALVLGGCGGTAAKMTWNLTLLEGSEEGDVAGRLVFAADTEDGPGEVRFECKDGCDEPPLGFPASSVVEVIEQPQTSTNRTRIVFRDDADGTLFIDVPGGLVGEEVTGSWSYVGMGLLGGDASLTKK